MIKLLGRKSREHYINGGQQRPDANQIKLRPKRYTLHAINNKIYFLRSLQKKKTVTEETAKTFEEIFSRTTRKQQTPKEKKGKIIFSSEASSD